MVSIQDQVIMMEVRYIILVLTFKGPFKLTGSMLHIKY